MFLPDVNVLIYAHREESPNHFAYLQWLEDLINGTHVYGTADLVLSGFLRIVTHPRVFDPPSSFVDALALSRKFAVRITARSFGLRHDTGRFSVAYVGNPTPKAVSLLTLI